MPSLQFLVICGTEYPLLTGLKQLQLQLKKGANPVPLMELLSNNLNSLTVLDIRELELLRPPRSICLTFVCYHFAFGLPLVGLHASQLVSLEIDRAGAPAVQQELASHRYALLKRLSLSFRRLDPPPSFDHMLRSCPSLLKLALAFETPMQLVDFAQVSMFGSKSSEEMELQLAKAINRPYVRLINYAAPRRALV